MFLRLVVALTALLDVFVTSSVGCLLLAASLLEVTWDFDIAPDAVRDLRETNILTCKSTSLSGHAFKLTCSASGQDRQKSPYVSKMECIPYWKHFFGGFVIGFTRCCLRRLHNAVAARPRLLHGHKMAGVTGMSDLTCTHLCVLSPVRLASCRTCKHRGRAACAWQPLPYRQHTSAAAYKHDSR